jgi:hypothetical protein
MMIRFLDWFLVFIYIHFIMDDVEVKSEPEPIPPMVEELRTILVGIANIPDAVKNADVYDRLLLNTIQIKFNNVQHIRSTLLIFKKALGDQIDEPTIYHYIDGRDVFFESLGIRETMIAYFQSCSGGGNEPIQQTLNFISKEVEDLIQLYIQITKTPDIEDIIVQYFDRRLNVLVRELARYVDGIANIGRKDV